MKLDADSAIMVSPRCTFQIDANLLLSQGVAIENKSKETVWIQVLAGRFCVQIGGPKPTSHNGANENPK